MLTNFNGGKQSHSSKSKQTESDQHTVMDLTWPLRFYFSIYVQYIVFVWTLYFGQIRVRWPSALSPQLFIILLFLPSAHTTSWEIIVATVTLFYTLTRHQLPGFDTRAVTLRVLGWWVWWGSGGAFSHPSQCHCLTCEYVHLEGYAHL